MDFNVLDDASQDYQANAKIKYLETSKNQLNIRCNELSLNNQVLRNVINSLTQETDDEKADCQKQDSKQKVIKELVFRNKQLQDKFIKFQRQIQSKQAQIFLNRQINIHNERETQQIIQNYSEKILELRKLIYAKQHQIQEYEKAKLKLEDLETVKIPPYACSAHFCAEISDYKSLIESYDQKTRALQNTNNELIEANKTQYENLKTMEKALKSRCTYQDYLKLRNTLQQQQIYQTNPCQQTKISQSRRFQSSYSSFLSQSRESQKQPIPRKLINKLGKEKEKLMKKIKELQQKNKELVKINESLVSSNNLYQKKRKQMNDALMNERKYYKSVLYYVLKRSTKLGDLPKVVRDDVNQLIFVKKQIQTNASSIQKASLQYKQQWKQLKEQVEKLFIEQNLTQSQNIKRSYSSAVDYISSQKNAAPVKKKSAYFQESFNFAEKQLGEEFSVIVGGNQKFSFSRPNHINGEELSFNFDDD